MMCISPEIRSVLKQSVENNGNGQEYLQQWKQAIGKIPGHLREMPYPYRNGIMRLDLREETDFSGMDEICRIYGLYRVRIFVLPEEQLLHDFLRAFLSFQRKGERTESMLPILSGCEKRNNLCPDKLNVCERTIVTLLFMGDTKKLPLLCREKETEIRRSYAGRLRRKEGCAPYCALAAAMQASGQFYPDGYPFWEPEKGI